MARGDEWQCTNTWEKKTLKTTMCAVEKTDCDCKGRLGDIIKKKKKKKKLMIWKNGVEKWSQMDKKYSSKQMKSTRIIIRKIYK